MKEENRYITQQEYEDFFSGNGNDSKSRKLEKAFIQASDIRKFEIDLYWKRASYFWALISVAFAGYFAVFGAIKEPFQFLFSYIIAIIGIVFTLAWLLANRGSKHWLENWENHIDFLEDSITGPLYKIVLTRSDYDDNFERYITGPKAFSVSKINQCVAVFVCLIWVLLAVLSLILSLQQTSYYKSAVAFKVILISAPAMLIIFIYMVLKKSRTHEGNHHPYARLRTTAIKKKLD